MKGKVEPRMHFFNEQGGMLPPFSDPAWRGCVLDRDHFDNTRLPELLFNAVVAAVRSAELFITRYAPSTGGVAHVAANWQAYSSYLLAPPNWSLEYVVFDASEQWAVLADADATVFGATPELAARVDAQLSVHGTSLVQVTNTEFPGFQNTQSEGTAYVLAVMGQ